MKFFNRYFFIGLGAGSVLTIIILIAGGYILFRSLTLRTGERIESILKPPPFPSDARMDYHWRVRGLDGKELDVAGIKGKVIFLNFWATWCPPCVAEMPSIQGLYDRVKSREISFMCVSEEDGAKVMNFVEERGYSIPIYTLIGKRPQVLETKGIPVTFIISQEGQIVFKHVGAAKWDDKTSIEFIERLLEQKP